MTKQVNRFPLPKRDTRHEQLEGKLAKGQGLTNTEWSEIKSYRGMYLVKIGYDPKEFNLGSRTCNKR